MNTKCKSDKFCWGGIIKKQKKKRYLFNLRTILYICRQVIFSSHLSSPFFSVRSTFQNTIGIKVVAHPSSKFSLPKILSTNRPFYSVGSKGILKNTIWKGFQENKAAADISSFFDPNWFNFFVRVHKHTTKMSMASSQFFFHHAY